jgi:hypothetical protein
MSRKDRTPLSKDPISSSNNFNEKITAKQAKEEWQSGELMPVIDVKTNKFVFIKRDGYYGDRIKDMRTVEHIPEALEALKKSVEED